MWEGCSAWFPTTGIPHCSQGELWFYVIIKVQTEFTRTGSPTLTSCERQLVIHFNVLSHFQHWQESVLVSKMYFAVWAPSLPFVSGKLGLCHYLFWVCHLLRFSYLNGFMLRVQRRLWKEWRFCWQSSSVHHFSSNFWAATVPNEQHSVIEFMSSTWAASSTACCSKYEESNRCNLLWWNWKVDAEFCGQKIHRVLPSENRNTHAHAHTHPSLVT